MCLPVVKMPTSTQTLSICPLFLKIYFIFDYALAVGDRCAGECRPRRPGALALTGAVATGVCELPSMPKTQLGSL